MLSKKRYIVDIEDFIYGFKKNEKESEVMLNYLKKQIVKEK